MPSEMSVERSAALLFQDLDELPERARTHFGERAVTPEYESLVLRDGDIDVFRQVTDMRCQRNMRTRSRRLSLNSNRKTTT